MSARVHLVWPEVILSGYDDPEYSQLIDARAEPDFQDNNCANWLSMLEEVEYQETLRAAGCEALLAYTTEGLPYEQIKWVSPADMTRAADRLIELIQQGDESIKALVAEYEDYAGRSKPLVDQLVDDLNVVKRKAQWAEALGKTQIAFDFLL